MGQKINKAQRKAAGHSCLLIFHAVMSAGHMLQHVARPVEYDEARHVRMGTKNWMGEGLSDKEQAYVMKKADELLDLADTIRGLGQRFLT